MAIRWIGRFLAFGIPFAMTDTARRQVFWAISFLGSYTFFTRLVWLLWRVFLQRGFVSGISRVVFMSFVQLILHARVFHCIGKGLN